jgi:putative acetyltransferase
LTNAPNLSSAQSDADIADFKTLILEYAHWLSDDHGISLQFQGIDAELAGLPGKYAAPKGAIVIARTPYGDVLGCLALRPLTDTTGEIKRLFVRPDCRGVGVARCLSDEVIRLARQAGYTKLALDTGAIMMPAQRLYEKLGFSDIDPYYHNPYAARFMGRVI